MGWGSASGHMNRLIDAMVKHVPDARARRAVYRAMIREFRAGDWDTDGDCIGRDPAFDAALRGEDRRRRGR